MQSQFGTVPRDQTLEFYHMKWINNVTLQKLTAVAHLVKADQVELATHVDPLRTDAEDADPLQTPLRIHDASRHGRR